MKTILRLSFLTLLASVLFAWMALSSSAAPSGSDYDIWVGATPVTYENASDVLGDGRVSYDHATRTLTIDSASISGHVDYYSYELGVFCNSDVKTTVVIKGKCSFEHGIRIANGSVLIENADVTFSSDAMTAIILYHSENGKLIMKNSTVKASAAPMEKLDAGISLFYASALEMTDSTLSVTAECDDLGASLVHVSGDLSAVRSKIAIHQEIPVSEIALYTEGEVDFIDCELDFSGAMYTVYAPRGSISFLRSELVIRDSFYALSAASLSMTESTLDAEVFYDGVYLASDDTEEKDGGYVIRPTECVLDRSRLSVRQLAYSRLKKEMLPKLWATIDDAIKTEQYGGSYETFLSTYAADFAGETAFTAGFSTFCVSTSVLESELDLRSFTLGLYAIGDSSLYVSEGSSIRLDSERAAFIFFSERANALTVSDTLKIDGSLFITETDKNLSSLGRFLYVYAKGAPSYDKAASYSEEMPESLFRVIGGLDLTLRFSEYEPRAPWLWILLGAGAIILVAGGTVTLCLLRARKAKPTKKKK